MFGLRGYRLYVNFFGYMVHTHKKNRRHQIFTQAVRMGIVYVILIVTWKQNDALRNCLLKRDCYWRTMGNPPRSQLKTKFPGLCSAIAGVNSREFIYMAMTPTGGQILFKYLKTPPSLFFLSAFFCLNFSILPLLLHFVKPKIRQPLGVIGFLAIFWWKVFCVFTGYVRGFCGGIQAFRKFCFSGLLVCTIALPPEGKEIYPP